MTAKIIDSNITNINITSISLDNLFYIVDRLAEGTFILNNIFVSWPVYNANKYTNYVFLSLDPLKRMLD
jgi:hypothetical protein